MIENFFIVCKVVDDKLGEITGNIKTKYVNKCYELFENHYKFLVDVLQRTEVKNTSGSEVTERFGYILLLRQIPQIENQTNGPYHSISIQLQNQIKFSKNEIVAIMQEFNDYTSIDQGAGNRRGLQNLFKRLKDALYYVKTLAQTTSDQENFMKSMFSDIKESFDKLISKLEFDVGQYLNLGEEYSRNLRPVASIYEQIQEIYNCSKILDIYSSLRQDVGLDWLKAIKHTLLKINTFSESLNGQLMFQADYRKYEFSS